MYICMGSEKKKYVPIIFHRPTKSNMKHFWSSSLGTAHTSKDFYFYMYFETRVNKCDWAEKCWIMRSYILSRLKSTFYIILFTQCSLHHKLKFLNNNIQYRSSLGQCNFRLQTVSSTKQQTESFRSRGTIDRARCECFGGRNAWRVGAPLFQEKSMICKFSWSTSMFT